MKAITRGYVSSLTRNIHNSLVDMAIVYRRADKSGSTETLVLGLNTDDARQWAVMDEVLITVEKSVTF